MSSSTETTSDSSLSEFLFAAAVVVVCLMALAISVHAFRGRRFRHGPVVMSIEHMDPVRPMAIVAV